MLDALATEEDLAARGITWESDEDLMVETFLDEASAAVRAAAGVPISKTTSTVVLAGTCDRHLRLPGQPVREVTAAAIDGDTIDDWKLTADGMLWRRSGWQPSCEPASVTVTQRHGLLEVPTDIVGMVCSMVAMALRMVRSSTDGTGAAPVPQDVISIGIDDYRVAFRQDGDRNITVFTIPDRVQRRLKARFGGGASMLEPIR
jgi:hypothetical protein